MQTFNRIQAFLDSAKTTGIDIIAPQSAPALASNNDAAYPNYGLRFLSSISNVAGKAAIAGLMSMSVMASSFAGDIPKQDNQDKPVVATPFDAPIQIIATPKAEPVAESKKREIIESVLDTYKKYAPNGMTSRQIEIFPDFVGGTELLPRSVSGDLFKKDKALTCTIAGVYTSYADLLKGLPQDRVDLPSMRGFIIAHEDMHCRTSASIKINDYVRNLSFVLRVRLQNWPFAQQTLRRSRPV
jgi:hypothetical protein